MDLGGRGIELITRWELPVPYLYDDGGRRGVGNATVAIGILVHFGPYHELRGVCRDCDQWPRQREPHLWLTRKIMDSLLLDKANARGRFVGGQNYVGAVNAAFPAGIGQNMFDAACSYTYNYGSFGPPARLARAFYGGRDMYATFTDPAYLKPAWAAAGLLARRKDEHALWSSGAAPLPTPAPPQDEEDEMAKILSFWTGAAFADGDYEIKLWVDCGRARSYVLRALMAADSPGEVAFKHGTFAPAARVARDGVREFSVVPGVHGTAPFTVTGGGVRFGALLLVAKDE